MIVESRFVGRHATGLHVDLENVRRYFPPRFKAIDLHFDHLRIQFALESDFWMARPEIRDPCLRDWLELRGRMSGVRSCENSGAAAFTLFSQPGETRFGCGSRQHEIVGIVSNCYFGRSRDAAALPEDELPYSLNPPERTPASCASCCLDAL